MVFLTVDNKELEKAVEEKELIPYLIAGDVKETVEEPKTEEKAVAVKVVKNASRGKNK